MNDQVEGMNRAAMRAMAAGDMAGARTVLLEALGHDRTNIRAWLNLAVVRRQLNDLDGAFDALREVLALESRNFPALLMRATLLDRLGQTVQAATAYGIALAQAPLERYLDPPTRQALERARIVHGKYIGEIGKFIRDRASDWSDQCTPIERRRIESFIDTTLRTRKRYQQEPLEYYYPGLPAIEFYDRSEFPWLQ